MDQVRWGIIGCGDVTEIKSGPAFQKATGSALVAVMRRDAMKAKDFAVRHGVEAWYGDAGQLINDPRVNAVYIATPPGSHEEYANRVSVAGKACYVEKPMARNAAEAQRMVMAFAERNIPLFVAYYRRAQPRFLKVRQLLDQGVLGRLQRVEYHYADGQMSRAVQPAPWRVQAEEAGGGLFLDLGCHALDLLDYLVGPLQRVAGQASNRAGAYEVEDHVEMSFEIPAGAAGIATWDFASLQRRDEYALTGERGQIRFSCFNVNEPLRIDLHGTAPQSIAFPPLEHVQQPLIQMIVDELRGHAVRSLSTGSTGLRTQQVMDEVLRSYYGDRNDGFWTRSPLQANS